MSKSRNRNEILILKNDVEESDFTKPVAFKPKNANQKKAWEAVDNNSIIFLNGSAGTGKTFLAVSKALNLIEKGSHKRIILIRPASVSEEEQIGFLSGSMQDKISPLILPMTSTIDRLIGKAKMMEMVEDGFIQGYSLSHVQGLNYYDDTIVILDEYQSATAKTLRMLMSRMWDKAKLIIMGDKNQVNLAQHYDSSVFSIDRYRGKKGIAFIDFTREDIVRSNICKIVDSCWEDEKNDETYTTEKY